MENKSLLELKIIAGMTEIVAAIKYGITFLLIRLLNKYETNPSNISNINNISFEPLKSPVRFSDCDKSSPLKRASNSPTERNGTSKSPITIKFIWND